MFLLFISFPILVCPCQYAFVSFSLFFPLSYVSYHDDGYLHIWNIRSDVMRPLLSTVLNHQWVQLEAEYREGITTQKKKAKKKTQE